MTELFNEETWRQVVRGFAMKQDSLAMMNGAEPKLHLVEAHLDNHTSADQDDDCEFCKEGLFYEQEPITVEEVE